MNKEILTQEGKDRLEEELVELKTNARKEVAQQIKEARALGDLSENAEYHAAKDRQGEIEDRITEIENILRNAEVIEEDSSMEGRVSPGQTVTVYDEEMEEEISYKIVGSTEADPGKNWISNESPVGAALLGRQEGETVTVMAPGGEFSLKILRIAQ
ncbi:MAG: transcription elongation factor GreA [Firmicutes bacterium]|nr:transcription elongation factor GreA [Bacillota bacterium]